VVVISIGFTWKPKYFSREKSGRLGSWCCEPRSALAHGRPRQGNGGGLNGALTTRCSGLTELVTVYLEQRGGWGGSHRQQQSATGWLWWLGNKEQWWRRLELIDAATRARKNRVGDGKHCGGHEQGLTAFYRARRGGR
jgi:hypothetical protein